MEQLPQKNCIIEGLIYQDRQSNLTALVFIEVTILVIQKHAVRLMSAF